jgi:hypothetical protein
MQDFPTTCARPVCKHKSLNLPQRFSRSGEAEEENEKTDLVVIISLLVYLGWDLLI